LNWNIDACGGKRQSFSNLELRAKAARQFKVGHCEIIWPARTLY